jgi:hypothetical protein
MSTTATSCAPPWTEAIAGRAFRGRIPRVWQDGTMRWLMPRGAARYLEDGSAQSLIGFTIDITARKASELYQAVAAEEQRAARSQRSAAPGRWTISWRPSAMSCGRHCTPSCGGPRCWNAAPTLPRAARRRSHRTQYATAGAHGGRPARQRRHCHREAVGRPAAARHGALAATVAEDLRLDAESREVTLIVAAAALPGDGR